MIKFDIILSYCNFFCGLDPELSGKINFCKLLMLLNLYFALLY